MSAALSFSASTLPQLKGLLQRSRSLSRLARGVLRQDRPVYAHFGITHRCDITCRMCGIWRYGNEDEELDLPGIARLAEVLEALGVVQLAIGGGEPFTRKDLAEVIWLLKQRGLTVRIVTNGMNYSEERIREVAQAGLDAVSISLDSLSRGRFAWICMQQDALERVVQNMVRFSELLPRTGAPLVMNTVVSRENILELPELVGFAQRMGFFISLIPVELAEDPQDRANKFITHQPRMRMTDAEMLQLDEAYDRLLQLKAQGAPILSSTPYLIASRRYFRTGAFPTPCDAGRLYFSINPAGMMTICHRGVERKSILEADFVEHMRSRVFREDAKKEADACEGCVRPCWIDTSFMFHTLQGVADAADLMRRGQQPRALVTAQQALSWTRA